jgi:hypothetical protein
LQQIFVPIVVIVPWNSLQPAWPVTLFELFHAAAIQIGFPARQRRRPSDKLQRELTRTAFSESMKEPNVVDEHMRGTRPASYSMKWVELRAS